MTKFIIFETTEGLEIKISSTSLVYVFLNDISCVLVDAGQLDNDKTPFTMWRDNSYRIKSVRKVTEGLSGAHIAGTIRTPDGEVVEVLKMRPAVPARLDAVELRAVPTTDKCVCGRKLSDHYSIPKFDKDALYCSKYSGQLYEPQSQEANLRDQAKKIDQLLAEVEKLQTNLIAHERRLEKMREPCPNHRWIRIAPDEGCPVCANST